VTVIAGGVGAVAKSARLGIGTAEAVEKSAVRFTALDAAEKNSVRLTAEGAAGNNEQLLRSAKRPCSSLQWHLHTSPLHGRNSSHPRADGSPNSSAAIASSASLLST
jgi:hypothetical protein